MRLYLELYERGESPESLQGELDFIRIDVTDYSAEDLARAKNLLKELADASYQHYLIQLHYCYHDVGGVCRAEVMYEK